MPGELVNEEERQNNFATNDDVDSDMEIEENAIIECQNEDDIDNSDDELGEDLSEINENATIFTARDGTEWSNLKPPENRRTLQHNIRRNTRQQGLKGGPKPETKMFSQRQTFKHIFSNEICDIIIRETNRRAKESCAAWNANNPNKTQKDWKALDEIEFDAYIGLLLFAGVSKSNYEHTKDLWSGLAHPMYRATMSLHRFWQISKYIRFDNPIQREQLLAKGEKDAAIQGIWCMLNERLRNSYNAGDNITIDEQLYPYRGRTRFTQYIPSKPARYGLKVFQFYIYHLYIYSNIFVSFQIWWVCDATSSYPLQGKLYTGMRPDGQREKNQGERVVIELCGIFKGSGRNVTCDNFFTTFDLAKKLMAEYTLSIIGTVNRKRTFIPSEFLVPKGRSREIFSSVFGFRDDVTLCSYFPKKNKAVVLLSTSHYTTEVVGTAKKPLIIIDYNRTKGGVDNMDKMLGEYSCKRRTLRWPLAFFYNMLDVSALAAYVIFQENNTVKSATDARRKFIQELCLQLVLPNVQKRANNTHITRNFSSKNAIESILQTRVVERMNEGQSNTVVRDSTGRIPQKGRCYLCKKKRPTRKACQRCQKPVCNEHSIDHTICAKC